MRRQDIEMALQLEKEIEELGRDLAGRARDLRAVTAAGEKELRDEVSFASLRRLDSATEELRKISEQIQTAAQNAQAQTLAMKRKKEEEQAEEKKAEKKARSEYWEEAEENRPERPEAQKLRQDKANKQNGGKTVWQTK